MIWNTASGKTKAVYRGQKYIIFDLKSRGGVKNFTNIPY